VVIIFFGVVVFFNFQGGLEFQGGKFEWDFFEGDLEGKLTPRNGGRF